MDDLELLARMGTDASQWAFECAGNLPPEWRADPMTLGSLGEFLTTWFANAIKAGESLGRELAADDGNGECPACGNELLVKHNCP